MLLTDIHKFTFCLKYRKLIQNFLNLVKAASTLGSTDRESSGEVARLL